MTKPYDDSNWREEYKSYTSNKTHLELLENGPKQLSQAWILGALYNKWKKIKGYDKLDPKENEGQLQSSMKEFFARTKDQGICQSTKCLMGVKNSHFSFIIGSTKRTNYV